uniref:Peptide/nickel transport system substrate-binding protein n=1 Tax=uncultured Chloroflexota bacterium TaxID=166587 RepID=H5SN42_9CHLR|nr:peptide/nickel transport system substrate-binding protein [uncultured Chloroflexota bacterium]
MAAKFHRSKMNRRQFLRLLGLTGTGIALSPVLSACSGQSAPPPTTAAQATSAPAPTATPTPQPLPQSVVIAYNDEIKTLEPHKVSRNLTQLSPHRSIWDPFRDQDRNLVYQPGVIKNVNWAPDADLTLDVEVQQGIKFHNGDDLTAEDVAFSFQRMQTEGFAYAGIWRRITQIDMKDEFNLRLTLDRYDPSIMAWMGFLNALVIPKKYFEEVGEEGFLQNPVGSGPYKFKEFVAGSHLTLEAFEDYWRGPAAIKTVTFEIVTDATARAAAIEAGTADLTLEIPIADFERLSSLPDLKGVAQPVTDVAVLFVAPYFEPFGDERVRLALHYALDKKSIVDNVLLGFGIPVSTTEAPQYMAYPEDYTFPYDPDKARELLAEAGYTPDNPLKITVFSTNGFKTRDFEVMQAAVEMWRQVGVEAEIETVTIPQFFELRNTAQLKSLALYFWSNATGDPINSVALSNFPPSPFSAFKGDVDYTGLKDELTEKLAPIFSERDEAKRIAAAKEGAIYVVEHGLMIPLYQVVSPIVMKKNLQYEPYPQGWLVPYDMKWT